jgi:hypothetical protein
VTHPVRSGSRHQFVPFEINVLKSLLRFEETPILSD